MSANIVRKERESTPTNVSKQESVDEEEGGGRHEDETDDTEDYPTMGTFAQLGVLSEAYIESILEYQGDDEDEDMGGLADSYFERS
jgi:hypothetical protein